MQKLQEISYYFLYTKSFASVKLFAFGTGTICAYAEKITDTILKLRAVLFIHIFMLQCYRILKTTKFQRM